LSIVQLLPTGKYLQALWRAPCPNKEKHSIWKDKVLNFHVFGWGPVAVCRYREGEQLIWEYADGSTTRMNRICQLPDEHKTPSPRGARLRLFQND